MTNESQVREALASAVEALDQGRYDVAVIRIREAGRLAEELNAQPRP